MVWFSRSGYFALLFLISGKVKRLEAAVKRLERKQRGDNMKKLKISIVLMLITITCFMTACGGSRTLSDIVNEKVGSIVSIEVMNGNNGEIISYTKEEDIEKFKEYMQKVTCTKSSPASGTGWSYSFEILGENGVTSKVTFAGTHSSIDNEKYSLTYPDIFTFMSELK